MDELKFIKKLSSSSPTKEEGAAFLAKLKTASGAGAYLNKQLAASKDALMWAGIGGGGVAGATYASNKKNKHTGVSKAQIHWSKSLENSNRAIADTVASGKKPGFSARMGNTITRGSKEMSDTFAEHPIKGSLMAGAMLGLPTGMMARWTKNLFFKK